jgi:hypothetical protein
MCHCAKHQLFKQYMCSAHTCVQATAAMIVRTDPRQQYSSCDKQERNLDVTVLAEAQRVYGAR